MKHIIAPLMIILHTIDSHIKDTFLLHSDNLSNSSLATYGPSHCVQILISVVMHSVQFA